MSIFCLSPTFFYMKPQVSSRGVVEQIFRFVTTGQNRMSVEILSALTTETVKIATIYSCANVQVDHSSRRMVQSDNSTMAPNDTFSVFASTGINIKRCSLSGQLGVLGEV